MALAIEGSLAERPFYKVLTDISFSKATGVLTVQGESDTIDLTFEFGLCVFVESHYPRPGIQLGQLLVNSGYITNEQLNELIERQKKNFLTLGYLAKEAGYITATQLMDVLENQMLLILFPAFTWKNGLYYFREEESVTYDRDSCRPLDLSKPIELGETILKQWNWIRQRLPVFEQVPTLLPDVEVLPSGVQVEDIQKSERKQFVLTPEQEKLYNVINGVFTIRQVLDYCQQFEWFSIQAIIDLEDAGVISIPPLESPRSWWDEQRENLLEKINIFTKYVALLAAVAVIVFVVPWLSFSMLPPGIFQGIPSEKPIFAQMKMDRIQFALENSFMLFDKYPDSITELVELKLLKEDEISDVWGQKFYYQKQNNGFVLICSGRDGKWATDDDLSVEAFGSLADNGCFFPKRAVLGKAKESE